MKPESFSKQILQSRGRGIFVWVFFLVSAIGLVMSLLPALTTRVFASSFNGTSFKNTNCLGNNIHLPICKKAEMASGEWMNYVAGLAAVVTFFVTPMIGSLSDIYGRKNFLAVGTLLALAPLVFLSFIYVYPKSSMNLLHLYYYAYVIGGGISNFGLAVSLMYIADMFRPSQRAVVFAIFLASVELILAGVPIVGVHLYELDKEEFHGLIPWLISMVFMVGSIVTASCLPEAERYNTIANNTIENNGGENNDGANDNNKLVDVAMEEDNQPMSPRRLPWSPGSHTRVQIAKVQVASCFRCKSCAFNPFKALLILNRSNFFRFLAATSFFQNTAVAGMNIISNYIQLYTLKMGLIQMSNCNAIQALSGVFVQVFLVRPLISCIGLRKVLHLGNLGLFLTAVANLFTVYNVSVGTCSVPVYNVSSGSYMTESQCSKGGHVWTPKLTHENGITLYVIANSIGVSIAMLVFPAISALKANNVSMHEQGGTLGALWSTRALSSAIAPVLFGTVYHTYQDSPWTVYYLSGGFSFLALLSGLFVPAPEHFSEYGGDDEVVNVESGAEDGGDGAERGIAKGESGGNQLRDPLL
jgi:MFS family permease